MRIGKYEVAERNNVGVAVTFLLMGLGAGAIVALLFAPKSGKQLRRDLRRKLDDARETIDDWTEEARDRAEEVMERGTELAEDLRDAARDKVGPFAKSIRNRR
jgi:gas vesicle protein